MGLTGFLDKKVNGWTSLSGLSNNELIALTISTSFR